MHVTGKVWSKLYKQLKSKGCLKYFQQYKEITTPSGGHVFSPISIILEKHFGENRIKIGPLVEFKLIFKELEPWLQWQQDTLPKTTFLH